MSFTDSSEGGCICCGECCRGGMHVYLNPDDLLLISRFSGLSNTYGLFEQKIVIIDYERNGAPVPRLRFSKGPAGCCSFLENRLTDEDSPGFDSGRLIGLCRLHPEYKPLVCMLAPLYRSVDLDDGSEQIGFKRPLPGCPGYIGFDEKRLPDMTLSAGLKERLRRETDFFRMLSGLIADGMSEKQIIGQLYYFDC